MIEEFRKLYGSVEGLKVFRAPGRVNLIGEHTDYNLGFVMPVALDLATYVAAAPAAPAYGKLRIYSEGFLEMGEWAVDSLGSRERSRNWTDYPIGVAQELIHAGFPIAPANLLIRSTVPEGSGLSSSAALEVSSALAFLNGRSMAPLELARLCQRAEITFVGMPCGIMDQYVSVFGREHMAIEIDCRSLTHREVPLPDGASFIAVNSMVKHALAGSAYKDRVQECASAAAALGVKSLREATPEQVAAASGTMTEVVARRAKHVVTEIRRVGDFVSASSRGDLPEMGRLLVESHRSLQHDYEVSCEELDFLVDAALKIDGVYGSRMTGGGFGGCTVTMLRPDAATRFQREISDAYQGRFGVIPRIYPCHPSAGAGEIPSLAAVPDME
jgi:galactokinase